jgi:broad specificity phosphatase PhoE
MTLGGRLILVRHGETVGNSSIRYFGRTDVPLSDFGRAQMLAVAKWLKLNLHGNHFDAVFASPLCRATEGARLIAGASASVLEIEEFVEVDFGLFEGLTAEEIRERHPIEFERWNRDRLDPNFTYPRGESRAAFKERVGCGIERVLELCDAAASIVLIVAHRGVIRAITQRLAEVAPIIELGSIQILRRDENPHGHAAKWRVEVTDMIDHLKGVG